MKIVDMSWVLSMAGVVGAILNIKKKKSCFLVWNISNLGWITLALFIPEFEGQTPLWIAFTILNIWGYFEWRKAENAVH